MRATRDLLRRRTYLVRKRAELLAHVQMTFLQYNLPPLAKKLCYAANRADSTSTASPTPSTRTHARCRPGDRVGARPADQDASKPN